MKKKREEDDTLKSLFFALPHEVKNANIFKITSVKSIRIFFKFNSHNTTPKIH